jgi:hypothetical protein
MSLLLLFLPIPAAVAATGGADAATFTASQSLLASVAATESRDNAAFSFGLRLAAALGATEARDTASLATALRFAAAIAAIRAHDAAAFSLSTAISVNLALAATSTRDAASIALTQKLAAAFAAAEQRDAAAALIGQHLGAALGATASSDAAVFSLGFASVNVHALQMWTVRASVMADEDFNLGPLAFVGADGSPLDLTGVSFVASSNGLNIPASVSGNAVRLTAPAGSVKWSSGRFTLSLVATDGVRTHELFANSTIHVGRDPLQSAIVKYGAPETSVNVTNTPNGWGRA